VPPAQACNSVPGRGAMGFPGSAALTSANVAQVETVDNLDGPVADPAHHAVLFENEHVRVLETVIEAGDITPLHSHLAKHLMIASSGTHFVRRDATGAVVFDTRATDPPSVIQPIEWSDGTPAHTLENTGDDPIRVTVIEIKPST
jgi:hypothetical protein